MIRSVLYNPDPLISSISELRRSANFAFMLNFLGGKYKLTSALPLRKFLSIHEIPCPVIVCWHFIDCLLS